MADTDREPANQDSQQHAALFRDMLLDALHAMRSMDEVESLAGRDNKARSPEGILERIAGFTGSALRLGAKATDTSLRVGRALINSQDQLRAMLTAGQSMKDIREVAGLTLSEMSEALNLKDKSLLEAIERYVYPILRADPAPCGTDCPQRPDSLHHAHHPQLQPGGVATAERLGHRAHTAAVRAGTGIYQYFPAP